MSGAAAHVASGSAGEAARPSIFDVLAQESLISGLRPALRLLVKYLAALKPAQLGPVQRWYEELYTLLEGLLENHYLNNYSASFSENFYGMKRVALTTGVVLSSKQRLRSLLIMVFVPYLRLKLDEFHANLKAHLESKRPTGKPLDKMMRAFVSVYPMVNTGIEAMSLLLQLGYVTGKTPVHSPWLVLAGARLSSLSAADVTSMGGDSAAPLPSTASFGARVLRLLSRLGRGSLLLLSRLLGLGLFLVQFLDWWQNSREAPSRPAALAAAVPRAPQTLFTSPADVLRLDPGTCPLCRHKRRNDTLLTTSGYVFCYACIFRHLEGEGSCPVTQVRASHASLVRLFLQ